MEKKSKDPIEFISGKETQLINSISKAGRAVDSILKSIWYNTLMFVFVLFSSFVLLLFLSPYFIGSEHTALRGTGALLYNIVSFTKACHQLPQRSISLFGAHMPVDARSFGVYFGILLGVIVPLVTSRFKRIFKSRWILLFSILPLAVDGISQTVLVLRESNNLLRILTGFIFGFGFSMFFISYFFRKYRRIKPCITRWENLTVTVFVTVLLISLFILSAGKLMGEEYMSKGEAIAFAINHSTGQYNYVSAYYVAPRVIMSIHFDPFIENYNDFVLKDVKKLDWDEIAALSDETGSQMLALTGIWVVVLSDEEPVRKGKTIYTLVGGEYYYIDPLYRIIFDVKSH